MSFNSVIIVGYLGRDPELRHTQSGKKVCDFSVATTERRKGRDGEMEDLTTWFKCTAWERTAELANEYLRKGSQVYIQGPMILREWQDREGVTRTTVEVTVRDMKFLSKADDNGGSRESSRSEAKSASAAVDASDIPFGLIAALFAGLTWVILYGQTVFQVL